MLKALIPAALALLLAGCGLAEVGAAGATAATSAAEQAKQGKETEAAAVDARFQKVWAKADTRIRSSCLCRPDLANR